MGCVYCVSVWNVPSEIWFDVSAKKHRIKTPCGNSFSPLTFLIQLNSSNRACINEKYTLESNFKVSLSCNAHGWISVDFYYFEQIEKQNSLICDQVCNQTFIKYTHTHTYIANVEFFTYESFVLLKTSS